uniref:Elongin-C n=1 Tax=Spongospora subterranea TaxID=70186 RepID=A0A0H5QZH3_9EUKA|eukprot:CRZ00964.1 hypothetical protein [Spongospora subterranea]
MSLDDAIGFDQDLEASTDSSPFVKLISNSGHEFIVDRDVVMASSAIARMLTGPGQWGETVGPVPSITFENINTSILQKVIQYFYYKARYDQVGADVTIPDFEIKMEYALPLILSAHFLDC